MPASMRPIQERRAIQCDSQTDSSTERALEICTQPYTLSAVQMARALKKIDAETVAVARVI